MKAREQKYVKEAEIRLIEDNTKCKASTKVALVELLLAAELTQRGLP